MAVEPCPKCSTLLRPGEVHACVPTAASGKTADDMVKAIFERFSKPEEVEKLWAEDAAKLISACSAFKVAQARSDGVTTDLSPFAAWLDDPPAPPERQLEDHAPELDDDSEEEPLTAQVDDRPPPTGGEGSPDPNPRPVDRSARLVLVGRRTVPADRG